MKKPSNRASVDRAGYRLVLLGAGRPWRGHSPSAVQNVAAGGRVLDWLLNAFTAVPSHFVGGYHFSEVIEAYPELSTTINPNWEHTGSVVSFLLAVDSAQPTIASYTDIVIRPSVSDLLLAEAGDVVMVVDSQWQQRAAARTAEDIAHMEMLHVQDNAVVSEHANSQQVEFAGLIKFSPRALALLEDNREWLQKTYAKAHLAKLAEWFMFQKIAVKTVDIAGQWAELNTPSDLAQFLLGTKFETLDRLAGVLKHSHICEHIGITLADWNAQRTTMLDRIQQQFRGKRIIIRSSALGEDSWTSSMAGKYQSVADIPADDRAALTAGIESVVRAYGDTDNANQLLIEPYLSPVKMSGVVFTRTLKYRAPYYVINYDDHSSKTDTVTSGSRADLKSYTLLRDKDIPADCPADLKNLIQAIQEIEKVLGYNSLDIEFAIMPDDKIFILQVRPLTAIEERWRGSYNDVQERVRSARIYYADLCKSTHNLHGDTPVFGVMPDWNPAEIIGTRPTRFAESLYRYLVTDEIWATQRAEFGYSDVRPCPLMYSFAHHPYVDVGASFNSFIPASLNDLLKSKLANFYLQKLIKNPALHDKIEFEIAFTCLTPDYATRSTELKAAGFSEKEIAELHAGLHSINQNAFARYRRDIAACEKLLASSVTTATQSLSDAFHLLETCKWQGVLPFAHLARSAFIAMAILKSAVSENIISQHEQDEYLAGLNNITSQMRSDAGKVHDGAMSWDNFVNTYAHLRPGSYNIATPSYGENPDYYLKPIIEKSVNAHMAPVHAPLPWDKIAASCAQAGFDISAGELEHFVASSIEWREKAKFIFMRHVDAAFRIIKDFGQQLGISAEELAHLDMADLKAIATGHHQVEAKEFLQDIIARNTLEHEICLGVELPPLITCEQDFYAFGGMVVMANFIGSGIASAKIAVLADDDLDAGALDGKIVLIRQADPGWDWIFGHNIAGLITAWGGANSHMAIRAAELNIPAAIGTGESRWEHYSQAEELYLNCATHEIKVML